MPMNYKVSGVWKNIDSAHYKVSGTWKRIVGGWVNVSGTWKQFFAGWDLQLSTINLTATNASNGPCSAGVKVLRSGSLQTGLNFNGLSPTYSGVSGEWADPQSGNPGDSYHARMVYSSGKHLDVGTEDTWQALTTDREYNVQANLGANSGTFNGTLQISSDGGSTVDVSCSVTMLVTSFTFP